MTYNYSEDLRGLVVRKVLSGMSNRRASELYEVHRSTISKWVKEYRQDGNLSPNPRRSYKKRVSDEELLAYIDKRSDATLEEIAGHFDYKFQSIWYRLKKLGITRKKN